MSARIGLIAILSVLMVGAAYGHHGWTGYDETKTIELTGVIKEVGYENPHGFVALESGGKTYQVILAPPSRMQTRGLQREDLKVGATVTVQGYLHRKTTNEVRAERIIVAGKTTELR